MKIKLIRSGELEITFTRSKPPDRDCQFCKGTGKWMESNIPCVCLTDFSSRVGIEREVNISVKETKDGGAIVSLSK